MEELLDLYDREKRVTGKIQKRGEVIPEGSYRLVVTIWVKNSRGEYLMSRRHLNKPFGGYWEATGGSVIAGETSRQAAVREVFEELGIGLTPSEGIIIRQEFREDLKDFYDVWLFHSEAEEEDLLLQDTEVIDAKWMAVEEINGLWDQGKLHPYLGYYKEIIAVK